MTKNSSGGENSRKALRPSFLAIAVLQVLSMSLSHAADIFIDDVACTLNDAMILANSNTADSFSDCMKIEDEGSVDDHDVIHLLANSTISFDAEFTGVGGNSNNFTPTPFVQSHVTIEGNGSTIQRVVPDSLWHNERFSSVFGVPFPTLGESELTLNSLTIQNGELGYNEAGVYVRGRLNLNNVTITKNESTNEALEQGGGATFVQEGGAVTLKSSTITENAAFVRDGGILAMANSTVTLNNSTVSGNTFNMTGGGGIFVQTYSAVTLNDSTVLGNIASIRGGRILIDSRGSILLRNIVVADSFESVDCFVGPTGVITADKYNIIEDANCAPNVLSGDSRFGSLRNNGVLR